MGCRGVHFALEEGDEKRLLAAGDDEEVMAVVEEIEKRWEKEWLVESDKAWDAIHRCLGDGSLRRRGKSILEKVILGGRHLHEDSDYIVAYVDREETRAVASAIKPITKEWFREKYFALRKRRFGVFAASDYDGPIGEEDFEYSWNNFEEIRKFFERAAAAGRAVVFSGNQ